MALSRVNRLQQTSAENFGTGAFTTSAFTPANNTLLVVAAYAEEENDTGLEGTTLTITDSASLSWTSRAATTTSPSWSYGTRVWTAPVTTGTSMTVSIDAGAFNVHVYRVKVFEYSDYNTSTPVGATALGSDADGDGAATITLSAAPATTSEVLALAHCSGSSASSTTPGSGWTELFDTVTTGWANYQSQARSGSTSTSVDWADLSAGTSASGATLCAIEIIEAPQGAQNQLAWCRA